MSGSEAERFPPHLGLRYRDWGTIGHFEVAQRWSSATTLRSWAAASAIAARSPSIAATWSSRIVGCALIAEGVETEAEHEALMQLGVEYGQGYLYGRPSTFAQPASRDWTIPATTARLAASRSRPATRRGRASMHPARPIIRDYLDEIESYMRDALVSAGRDHAPERAAERSVLLAGGIAFCVSQHAVTPALAARAVAVRLLDVRYAP